VASGGKKKGMASFAVYGDLDVDRKRLGLKKKGRSPQLSGKKLLAPTQTRPILRKRTPLKKIPLPLDGKGTALKLGEGREALFLKRPEKTVVKRKGCACGREQEKKFAVHKKKTLPCNGEERGGGREKRVLLR